MTVYGNFEAIKQIFKTTHGSIWSARTAGTSEAPDCCIKLFQLDADMLENRDTTFAQNLLVAAALQQAMANKSEHWAPVYGLGSQGTNAFYVSRLYPRSAQSIVDYKTDLSSADLKIVMMAVIDALMDLDTAFHRSHGNLKPANVLIADRVKIRPGSVVLTDPDAAAVDRPSLTRTPDTKALGELLYALVTHNAHVTARYPLPRSAKWKQMGSTGKQWFAICGFLLNGATRRGSQSLEHIRTMIEGVQPTPRRVPRSLVTVTVLAGLCVAGYAKRDAVADWYHQTSMKVAGLVKPAKPLDNTAFVVRSSTSKPVLPPLVAEAPRVPKASAIVDPGPSVALVHPTVQTPIPLPIDPPTKPPVSVVTPTPAATTNPVIATESKPIVRQPVAASHDDDGVKLVLSTPPPEFHSAAATEEYNSRRSLFAKTYAGLGTATTLSDWTRIMSKLQGLDGDFPLVDANTTASWPAGLSAIMSSRRDAALLKAVDNSFDQRRIESEPYKRSLKEISQVSSSVLNARESLARGDVAAAQISIDEYNAILKSFPVEDADVSLLFGPLHQEFDSLAKVQASNDRVALLTTADNEAASLGLRLAAWYRAGSIDPQPWPDSLDGMAADEARADRFDTLLREAGSTAITKNIANIETVRANLYFSRLTDQALVLQELKLTHDPKYAAMLAKAPLWFRYDAALYSIRNTMPSQVTAEQKKAYSDLAGQVNAPGIGLVHDVLKGAQDTPPPSLTQSGPGSIKGWTLRSGWTRDHCTYISNSRGDTLEFLRVHLPNDMDGIDCFLCTTEVPIALLQHLLSGDPIAMSTAEALNASPTPPAAGMRIWNFNDKTGNVELDNDDYRKGFVVSPSEQLPAEFVTPQLAFYLARRVGCRLPSSKEWSGALAQAKYSADANMKGFATRGWKLRDRQFAKLLTNPNRDVAYWPDDNIFLPSSDRQIIPRARNAAIWTMSDLRNLGGSTTSDTSSGAAWPLSTLEASGGFGFRTVGDDENYAGVFHDLIGNVAEFVVDAPVILEEKVSVTPPLSKSDAVQRISDWFTDEHLHSVGIIGGSALSPPTLDPTKSYPLPVGNGPTIFSDVGFRLAFTDPASLVNAQKAVIAQSNYLVAPAK